MGRPSTLALAVALPAVLAVALSAALAPARAGAQSRTFPEELPEEATSGPRFDPARAARSVTLASEAGGRPDPSDPALPVALAFLVGVGYAMPSSIDDALATHLYADLNGAAVVTGDFQVTYRALEWLWLGGRFGFRGRTWGRDVSSPAHAGGFDLMAILHLRGQLGRVIDFGGLVGAGMGIVGLALNDTVSVGPAPRLSGGAELGFRLAPGARIVLRASWDFFQWFDLDRFGHDLDLGGPTIAAGLEIRS